MDQNDLTQNPPEAAGETYHRGPVIMRGPMIPTSTTSANLLSADPDTDWLHMDPWRVMRIQAEFVDGFGALAELGPAVTVFGSARTAREDPYYEAARRAGELIAQAGVATITGGGPGIMRRQTVARPRRAASPSAWASSFRTSRASTSG